MALGVRLKTLDGRWETVGASRLRGITPENIALSSNQHGSDTARFVLKRNPGVIWPDLSAFTPCEIDDDGVTVWSGRVWETPSKEGSDQQISIEGRGWQYHLDDEPITDPFVKTRYTAKDARQVLSANLQYFVTSGMVTTDPNGDVVVGFGKGTEIKNQDTACAIFDLGPNYQYFRPYMFIELESNLGPDAAFYCYVRAHNSPDPHSTGGIDYYDLSIDNWNTLPRGQKKEINFVASDARRYISVFVYYGPGAGTATDEFTVKVKEFRVFAYGAYKDAVKESALRASDVITESVKRSAPLLKQPSVKSPRAADEIQGNPTTLAHWRFNEESGSVAYDSGVFGHHLTATGSPTWGLASLLDNRLGDEDDNLSVQTPSGTSFGNTTLQAPSARIGMAAVFVRLTTAVYEQMVVYHGNTAADGWGLFILPSGNLAILAGGVGWLDTGKFIQDGEIYFVVAGYDGAGYPGRFVADIYNADTGVTQIYISPLTTPIAPSKYVNVAGQAPSNVLWDGIVDEVAIFGAPFDTKAQYGEIDFVDESGMERLLQATVKKQDGDVQRTGFWIPELPVDQGQTPRELIDAANAFHGNCWKVNHEPTVRYYEKPSTPKFEVGAWSGAEFEDASSNSGEEIYNEVRVEATDYLGEPLVARRGGLQDSETIGFTNGSFATTPSVEWSVTNGSIAQDTALTGQPIGAVSSTAGISPTVKTSSFYGTFLPGRIYRLEGRMYRTTNAQLNDGYITIVNGTTDTKTEIIPGGQPNFWFPIGITFRYETYGALELQIEQAVGAAGLGFYLDNFVVKELDESSLPSRRGFVRTKILPVNSALTQAAADRLGDVWLREHKRTPFKGSLRHTYPAGVRTVRGGAAIRPALMLNETCERILFSHRVDPDSGDWGREGTIDTVSYEESTGVASITIDNTRQSFEALLGRLAAVVGNVR